MNSIGPLPDLEFALPHALNLAEAGQKVQDKTIGTYEIMDIVLMTKCLLGYLYCAEMMPKSHELQLMLVNTVRKVRTCCWSHFKYTN